MLYIGKGDKYYILSFREECNYEENIKFGGLYAKTNLNKDDFAAYCGKTLDELSDLNDILNGIREYKKEELEYFANIKLQEYLDSKKRNQNYYDLQEKAILLYKLNGKSSVLSQIADKKNISVDDLVKSIEKKIDEHYNVIFNFKHSVDDLKHEIDQMTLDQLHDLSTYHYLEQVLYKKNHDLIDNFETISVETISVEKKLDGRLEESKLVTDSDQLVDQLADDINEKKKGKLRLFKK